MVDFGRAKESCEQRAGHKESRFGWLVRNGRSQFKARTLGGVALLRGERRKKTVFRHATKSKKENLCKLLKEENLLRGIIVI